MTEEEYDELRYEAYLEYRRQLAQEEEERELFFQHSYGMGENE
jgi:hypothetical protein